MKLNITVSTDKPLPQYAIRCDTDAAVIIHGALLKHSTLDQPLQGLLIDAAELADCHTSQECKQDFVRLISDLRGCDHSKYATACVEAENLALAMCLARVDFNAKTPLTLPLLPDGVSKLQFTKPDGFEIVCNEKVALTIAAALSADSEVKPSVQIDTALLLACCPPERLEKCIETLNELQEKAVRDNAPLFAAAVQIYTAAAQHTLSQRD